MTRTHGSPCVHRPGSDHPGADCNVCDRGDCEPGAEERADREYALAAKAEQDKAESWERSDTDGFLSQWASGLTADLHRTQARIIEAGGQHRFPALFTLAGEYVPATTVLNPWGQTRWHVLSASGFGTGTFLPYLPMRRQTLAKRGYVEGWVMRPAEAFMNGRGHGMSGSAWVDIRPTDLPWHTPTILSTDRWADQQEERTA